MAQPNTPWNPPKEIYTQRNARMLKIQKLLDKKTQQLSWSRGVKFQVKWCDDILVARGGLVGGVFMNHTLKNIL